MQARQVDQPLHRIYPPPVHFADFIITRHSSGVFIISPDLPLGLAAEELITAWEASEAEEWIDTIQFLTL
jgi:hypothetical protein